MPNNSLDQTLNQLNALKNQFNTHASNRVVALLKQLSGLEVDEAVSLTRLHEVLLFVRAHPHNGSVLRYADNILQSFPRRVQGLATLGADLSELEHPELSGVAGMSVTDTFTFPIVRWLRQHNAAELSFYWDWFEDDARIGETWPRFMPLLEEDTFVEASIPFREWLRTARVRHSEVSWLVDRFDQLDLPEKVKANASTHRNCTCSGATSITSPGRGCAVQPEKYSFTTVR